MSPSGTGRPSTIPPRAASTLLTSPWADRNGPSGRKFVVQNHPLRSYRQNPNPPVAKSQRDEPRQDSLFATLRHCAVASSALEPETDRCLRLATRSISEFSPGDGHVCFSAFSASPRETLWLRRSAALGLPRPTCPTLFLSGNHLTWRQKWDTDHPARLTAATKEFHKARTTRRTHRSILLRVRKKPIPSQAINAKAQRVCPAILCDFAFFLLNAGCKTQCDWSSRVRYIRKVALFLRNREAVFSQRLLR